MLYYTGIFYWLHTVKSLFNGISVNRFEWYSWKPLLILQHVNCKGCSTLKKLGGSPLSRTILARGANGGVGCRGAPRNQLLTLENLIRLDNLKLHIAQS